jgi:hypothetical protein
MVINRMIQKSPYIGINCIGIWLRRWLDRQFPGYWFGCRGHVEWPSRSPDLTTLGFYFWDHLKAIVYHVKLQNMNHLKESFRDGCGRITPDMLKRVRHEWERRIRMQICAINVMVSIQTKFCQ